MPELPDLESFKAVMERGAIGNTVAQTEVPDPRILADLTPQQLGRLLKGRKLKCSRRHGKYLFTQVADRGWLVLHFGMTGRLETTTETSDDDSIKLILHFQDNSRLLYHCTRMLGRVAFADDLNAYISDHDLGSDALSDDLDKEGFIELLSSYQGTLKSALMNQSLIAGIGNVWSDEILFRAGWRPDVKAGKLRREDLCELYRTMRKLLQEGAKYAKRGKELPDRLLVRHRDPEESCPRCGEPIQHADVAGRRAYYCKHCQSKTGND